MIFVYLLDETSTSLNATESRTNGLVGVGLLGNKGWGMDLQDLSFQEGEVI